MSRISRSHCDGERVGSGFLKLEIKAAVLCRTGWRCPYSELLHCSSLLACLVAEHHHCVLGVRFKSCHTAREAALIDKAEDTPGTIVFHKVGIYFLFVHSLHKLGWFCNHHIRVIVGSLYIHEERRLIHIVTYCDCNHIV